MSSITYAGHDFSDLCSAKVVERATCSVLPEALAVPGRAGALVVSGYVPPVEVTVRLFLDPGFRPTVTGLAEMRHRLRSWLTVPEGGTLTLPDDPDVEYRDALLTYAGDWSSLFEDGGCDVVFTLFDPIAWGTVASSGMPPSSLGARGPRGPLSALSPALAIRCR